MERFLEKGLFSLIVSEQLLSKIQVIVVNDGSRDKTLEIAKRFENKYPNSFVVVDKQNGNYGSCINAGLKIALGTFVKILDADDYYITTGFEKMIQELIFSEQKSEKVDLFFFDWRFVDEEDNVTKELSFDIPENKVLDITSAETVRYFNSIQHHAIAYRTSFLKKQNYIQTEGVSYSDTEWIYKPLLYVRRIKYCPVTVYSYLFGRADQSMSPSQRAKGFKSMLKIEQSMLSTYLASKGKTDAIHEEIFRSKFVSNITYFYSTYMIAYVSEETIKCLAEFDCFLKENCVEIYDAIANLTTAKPKIKYVKAFRKNPHGLKYKTIVSWNSFKEFLKRCVRRK